MSPAYGCDIAWIGIIMYKPYGHEVQYQSYFDHFQRLMMELGGRSHWAKLYSWWEPHEEFFTKAYPKYQQFSELRKRVDPDNIFSNSFLQRVFTDSTRK